MAIGMDRVVEEEEEAEAEEGGKDAAASSLVGRQNWNQEED